MSLTTGRKLGVTKRASAGLLLLLASSLRIGLEPSAAVIARKPLFVKPTGSSHLPVIRVARSVQSGHGTALSTCKGSHPHSRFHHLTIIMSQGYRHTNNTCIDRAVHSLAR